MSSRSTFSESSWSTVTLHVFLAVGESIGIGVMTNPQKQSVTHLTGGDHDEAH
jgi:hypothetical protein